MTYRNEMRFAWIFVLAAAAACGPDDTSGPCKDSLLAGDLVITEVFADYAAPTGGTGTDDGKEWFEIYNNTDRAVSLKGMTVVHSRPDGSKAKSHTMLDVTIAPGQYFTLGNSTSDLVPPYVDYGYSASLGDMYNTGGGKLALKCGGSEIDAAVYDSVRAGRSRQLSSALAPDYTLNDDLANWCEARGTEFETNNFGTPGEDNDCAPVIAGACSDGGVMREAVAPNIGDLVITEVMPRPKSPLTANSQWFEVLALEDVDLNGLVIDRANASVTKLTLTSAECIRVAAGSYSVFARSSDQAVNGGLTPLGVFNFTLNPTGSTPDIRLSYGGTVIDAVTWTTSTSGASRSLDPSSLTATDNDLEENFCDGTTPYENAGPNLGTPGAANPACGAAVGPGKCNDNGNVRDIVPPDLGQLVITEVMPRPAGTSTTLKRWFEITNIGQTAFDLNGLGIDRPDDSAKPDVIASATCKSLPEGGFAVFARSGNDGANGGLDAVDATFGFTMLTANGAVLVVDPTTCGDTSPFTCTKIFDQVTWATVTQGKSRQLQPGMYTTTANDDADNFCDGITAYGTDGNLGTPGKDNDCP
jgi:hypothetical protein